MATRSPTYLMPEERSHMMRRSLICILAMVLVLSCFTAASAGQWGLKVRDASDSPGAEVTSVTPGMPAEKAGLKEGDVITKAGGQRIWRAKDFVSLVKALPRGEAVSLTVMRSGWEKGITLTPGVKSETAHDASLNGTTAPPPGRVDGLKATIAVGDFQVKAAKADQFIGDGLREMLVTALYNSGYFIVFERTDVQGLVAEQALCSSGAAKKGSPVPGGKMDVPEILVYGAVTQFDPLGFSFGQSAIGKVAKAFMAFASGEKTAELVTDIRVVDVATGRVLLEQSVPGSARSVQGGVGTSIRIGDVSLPVCFQTFRNTPVEKAMRDCLQKATFLIVNNIPEDYYRHR
jgi:curli biogenesis system outer membrane secretion channel CsgG